VKPVNSLRQCEWPLAASTRDNVKHSSQLILGRFTFCH